MSKSILVSAVSLPFLKHWINCAKYVVGYRQVTADIRLEVDGGVKVNSGGEIAAAGANMFVAGSAIDSQTTKLLMKCAVNALKGKS